MSQNGFIWPQVRGLPHSALHFPSNYKYESKTYRWINYQLAATGNVHNNNNIIIIMCVGVRMRVATCVHIMGVKPMCYQEMYREIM